MIVIHIHSDSGNRICSSSVGTDCGEVLLIDSLVSDIDKLVILQIAQIYQVPETKSHLSIHSISVQQQKGSTDGGLFAIVFATEICTGHNLSDGVIPTIGGVIAI